MTSDKELKPEKKIYNHKKYLLRFYKSGFGVLVELYLNDVELWHEVALNKGECRILAKKFVLKFMKDCDWCGQFTKTNELINDEFVCDLCLKKVPK